MADIAILGSGGWGMALAVSAHLSGNNVTLWSPFDEEVKMLTEKRCNEKLLSGIVLPDGIKITSDISCVSGSALTILATPSTVIRSVAAQLAEQKDFGIVVNVSKGLEKGSLLRLSQVIGSLPCRGGCAQYTYLLSGGFKIPCYRADSAEHNVRR